MRKFAIVLLALFVPLGLFAARLTLRDGSVIYGRFLRGTPHEIVFQDNGGVQRTFDLDRVMTIDFNAVRADAGTAYRSEERRYGNRYALLPPGTVLSVRTDERIDSGNASEGQTFPAHIARDVMDQSGRVVIPRGAEAMLVVHSLEDRGPARSAHLVLDLDSVRVNGRMYYVDTDTAVASSHSGLGANRRTGEMVGGGAVLGTLLGAVTGGGQGAAIGAIAGGAAGAGAEVLTNGRYIRVPAETRLDFRLERPMDLREAM